MSFISKLWKSVRGVAGPVLGGIVGGPFGAVLGGALGGGTKTIGQVPSGLGSMSAFGASSTIGSSIFPAIGASRAVMPIARSIMPGVAGTIIRGGRGAMASANAYCRRHPVWCSTLPGGLAAVADMVSGGQLPPIKRRRAKGISGTELKNFRRVSMLMNKWCKVPAPTQRARRKC